VSVLLGDEIFIDRRRQSRYFSAIDVSNVKIVADTHRLATYRNKHF